MIKINKPAIGPMILDAAGNDKCAKGTNDLEIEYLSDQVGYDDGTKTFDIDSDIYGHTTIKQALIDCHHGKCAFCESYVTHIDYGDVEHFRPKRGYKQSSTGPLRKPGYYWLAYSWDNLLFSCKKCNQRHKKNLFPLENPSCWAKNHLQNIANEKPTFIHPAKNRVGHFITFREEMAVAKNSNPRGQRTIDELGLNRKDNPGLWEKRHAYLIGTKAIAKIANLPGPGPLATQIEIDQMRKELRRRKSKKGEYAAMVRANF